MKKLFWILGLAAAAAWLGFLPFQATDVANLIPAQTVFVLKDGTQYTVDVGAGVQAVGKTLKDALAALQEQTSGTVFFETCEQVVLMGDTDTLLSDVAAEEAFRPAAAVYTVSVPPDIGALSDYLHSHHGELTVSKVKAAAAVGETVKVPQVEVIGGGYRIVA